MNSIESGACEGIETDRIALDCTDAVRSGQIQCACRTIANRIEHARTRCNRVDLWGAAWAMRNKHD